MATTKSKFRICRLWMKIRHKRKTQVMRKRVRSALFYYWGKMVDLYAELDARLLEMYKDRSLQPHDPAGQSPTSKFTSEARLIPVGIRAPERSACQPEAKGSFARRRQLDLRG